VVQHLPLIDVVPSRWDFADWVPYSRPAQIRNKVSARKVGTSAPHNIPTQRRGLRI
jgi:hypothetical protein